MGRASGLQCPLFWPGWGAHEDCATPTGSMPTTRCFAYHFWRLKVLSLMAAGFRDTSGVCPSPGPAPQRTGPGQGSCVSGPTKTLPAKQPCPQSGLPPPTPLNGPDPDLNESKGNPGSGPKISVAWRPRAPAPQTPVHLIMTIRALFLCRQRRLLMRQPLEASYLINSLFLDKARD